MNSIASSKSIFHGTDPRKAEKDLAAWHGETVAWPSWLIITHIFLHSAPIEARESKVSIWASKSSFFTPKALPQEPGVSSSSPSEVERHPRYCSPNRTRASQRGWPTQRVIRALNADSILDELRSMTTKADGHRPPEWHAMASSNEVPKPSPELRLRPSHKWEGDSRCELIWRRVIAFALYYCLFNSTDLVFWLVVDGISIAT
jgi:hypothetical protein